MKPKTRGAAEAEITKAVIQFEKEYLGCRPLDARTTFLNDMILIRLKGILTPGDRKLAETQEGQTLLKESRRRMLESSCDFFYQMVQDVTGCRMVSFHTDMSTRTGERIVVLTVDRNLDEVFAFPASHCRSDLPARHFHLQILHALS